MESENDQTVTEERVVSLFSQLEVDHDEGVKRTVFQSNDSSSEPQQVPHIEIQNSSNGHQKPARLQRSSSAGQEQNAGAQNGSESDKVLLLQKSQASKLIKQVQGVASRNLAVANGTRRNFSSAKARLTSEGTGTVAASSPDLLQLDGFIKDPVYSHARQQSYEAIKPYDPTAFNLNSYKGGPAPSNLGSPDVEGQVHRERISNAVKKPKDLFAPTEMKPIQVASYVLGKFEKGGPRKASAAQSAQVKTRMPPTAPKAIKNSAPAKRQRPDKTNQPERSLSPQQKGLIVSMPTKWGHAKSTSALPPTSLKANPSLYQSAASKQFTNLKRNPSLPSAFIAPPPGAKSQNHSTPGKHGARSTSLPHIIPPQTSSLSGTDLEGLQTPHLNAMHLDESSKGTGGVQGSADTASKATGGKASRKKSNKDSRSRICETLLRDSSAAGPHTSSQDATQNETIDMEFFKRNKVKHFQDRNHVQKVLDKVFPSASKEEKDLERMIQRQDYLYEAVLDAADPDAPPSRLVQLNATGTFRQKVNHYGTITPEHRVSGAVETVNDSLTYSQLLAVDGRSQALNRRSQTIQQIQSPNRAYSKDQGSAESRSRERQQKRMVQNALLKSCLQSQASAMSGAHKQRHLSDLIQTQALIASPQVPSKVRIQEGHKDISAQTQNPTVRLKDSRVGYELGARLTPSQIESHGGNDHLLTEENDMAYQLMLLPQPSKAVSPLAMTQSHTQNSMGPQVYYDELDQAQATTTEHDLRTSAYVENAGTSMLSNTVQARKLAHLLNKNANRASNGQQQRSASVQPQARWTSTQPSMPKVLKQSAAALFERKNGAPSLTVQSTSQSTKVISLPDERVQMIERQLRQQTAQKMERVKLAHKESFEEASQNGPGLAGPQGQVKSHSLGPMPRSSQSSQFAQNVRNMNFFSIFVNNQVDEKLTNEKLAQTGQPSFKALLQAPESQGVLQLASQAHKDDKLARPQALTANGEPRKFKQELDHQPLSQTMGHGKPYRVASSDQKDDKQNDTKSPPCQCHTLSNAAIQELVLNSPIKDLVEQVHTYQFSRQNKTGATEKQTKGGGSVTQGGLISGYTINERTDVAVLNMLMNQITNGKYAFDKSQITEQLADGKNLQGLDRYIQGVNFKGMLSDIQKQVTQQEAGTLETVSDSESEDGVRDFFQLKTIKEKEAVLAELLETRQMPKKKPFVPGEAATFLTQVYKDSDHNLKELEEKFPNWAKARTIMKVSQEIINEHAESKPNVAQQKRIQQAKLKKEREVKMLFDEIHNTAQEAEKTAIGFFADQTALSQEEQANNAGKEQLLYLCFLELVRQVSGQCKDQAVLMVKLWHSYFDHYQHQMKSTLTKISGQTQRISTLLETMTTKFAKVLVIDQEKDLEFLALIDKHDKAMQLLELVSKGLYQEREHSTSLDGQLVQLKEDFETVLPNYEKYYNNKEFRRRLMKYSILETTDAWSHSERQQLHLTKPIKKAMDEQMERDPFQANIIKDIYRIQGVCNMRLPIDYALENAQESFQKASVSLKMKEIYYKNLQERAQRLKRQNEDLIKRIQDQKEHHDILMIQKEFDCKERIQMAVKRFRQEQLQSILSEPKEVQTDHELIEKYMADLENAKELGIRAMMIARRLTSVQMQQLRVVKAFEKQPKFKHLTKPIVHIMRIVRDNKSIYPAKTLKKTLEVIAECIQERLNLFNEPTDNFKIDYLNLEHFYAKFMSNKYGIDQLSMKYTEQWLVSIKKNSDRDPRVGLFMRFLGLSGYQSLPFSVFQFYLHMIKATNIDVDLIYKHQDPTTITLSYQKVMFGYKDLLGKTNIFNRRNIMTQLRYASKIKANNPVILRDLSFAMFETYRYCVEKVLKSQRYRSFSDLLNALFEQHHNAEEGQGKKKKGVSPSKKRGGGKRGARGRMLARSQTLADESLLKKAGSSIIDKSSQESSRSKSKQATIDIIDEITGGPSMDADARPTDIKLIQGTTQEYDARAADQAEVEKDFVKLSVMVKFICTELHMNRPADDLRLKDLLDVILISAQGANADKIGRFAALRCFTEKIEIQVPMDEYFHIGINGQIDHENSENMWLEKVFNFYSQLRPENYKAASGMDPDHRLIFSGEQAYDGLEFVQFYIFVKDGGSKLKKDKVMIYQVYEDECNQKNRQRLSCDDFIELIRKFHLIKNKSAFEVNMRMRYDQAKNRTVHLETQNKAVQVERANSAIGFRESTQSFGLKATITQSATAQGKKKSKSSLKQAKEASQLQPRGPSRNAAATVSGMTPLATESSDISHTLKTDYSALMSAGGGDMNKSGSKKDSSFDIKFQNAKVAFQTVSNSNSVVNVITPQDPNSKLAVLEKLKPCDESDDPSPDDRHDSPDPRSAQQYVMVGHDDGTVVMSPEPALGPSMLDDMAGMGTRSSNFQLKGSLHESPNPMRRPPSPISHTGDQSRIIDMEVQETIEKISKQLEQPQDMEKIAAQHAAGEDVTSGVADQTHSASSPPFTITPAQGVTENSVEEIQDDMIRAVVDKIDWDEENKRNTPVHGNIVLSRFDTMQALKIEKVDLRGYKRDVSTVTAPPALEEIEESPQIKPDKGEVFIPMERKRTLGAKDGTEKQMQQEQLQGVGFLDLMFGQDNYKREDINMEAKEYVEQEETLARKRTRELRGRMRRQESATELLSRSASLILEEQKSLNLSREKSVDRMNAASPIILANQKAPEINEANSRSETSSIESEKEYLKIEVEDTDIGGDTVSSQTTQRNHTEVASSPQVESLKQIKEPITPALASTHKASKSLLLLSQAETTHKAKRKQRHQSRPKSIASKRGNQSMTPSVDPNGVIGDRTNGSKDLRKKSKGGAAAAANPTVGARLQRGFTSGISEWPNRRSGSLAGRSISPSNASLRSARMTNQNDVASTRRSLAGHKHPTNDDSARPLKKQATKKTVMVKKKKKKGRLSQQMAKNNNISGPGGVEELTKSINQVPNGDIGGFLDSQTAIAAAAADAAQLFVAQHESPRPVSNRVSYLESSSFLDQDTTPQPDSSLASRKRPLHKPVSKLYSETHLLDSLSMSRKPLKKHLQPENDNFYVEDPLEDEDAGFDTYTRQAQGDAPKQVIDPVAAELHPKNFNAGNFASAPGQDSTEEEKMEDRANEVAERLAQEEEWLAEERQTVGFYQAQHR